MPAAQKPSTNYQYAAPPKSKKSAATIFGWILLFMGVFYLFSALAGNLDVEPGENATSGIITAIVIFCGGGGALIWLGGKNKRLHSMYTKYSSIIAGNPDASLEQLASTSAKPYAKVCADLQKLVDMGFFPGYYLDLNRKTFSCPAAKSARPAGVPTGRPQAAPTPAGSKVVKCPNCGGSNTLIGDTTECEYCGSPLG